MFRLFTGIIKTKPGSLISQGLSGLKKYEMFNIYDMVTNVGGTFTTPVTGPTPHTSAA